MASEVRFDEVSPRCGCDDFSVATGKELRDAIDMVVMTMCTDNVVLAFALGIERLVVVILNWIVLEIWPEVDVPIWLVLVYMCIVLRRFSWGG
jgi:hypothetical protein